MDKLKYLTVWRAGRLETGEVIQNENAASCIKLDEGVFQLTEEQQKRFQLLSEMAEVEEGLLVYAIPEKSENEEAQPPQEVQAIVEKGRNLYRVACEHPEITSMEIVPDLPTKAEDKTGQSPTADGEEATPPPKGRKKNKAPKPPKKKKEKKTEQPAEEPTSTPNTGKQKKVPIGLIVVIAVVALAIVGGSIYVLLKDSMGWDFSTLLSAMQTQSSSSAILDDSTAGMSESQDTKTSSHPEEPSSIESSSSEAGSVPKTEITLIIDAQPGTVEASGNVPVAPDSPSSEAPSSETEKTDADYFQGFNPNAESAEQ